MQQPHDVEIGCPVPDTFLMSVSKIRLYPFADRESLSEKKKEQHTLPGEFLTCSNNMSNKLRQAQGHSAGRGRFEHGGHGGLPCRQELPPTYVHFGTSPCPWCND